MCPIGQLGTHRGWNTTGRSRHQSSQLYSPKPWKPRYTTSRSTLRYVTFDRYEAFTRKQNKTGTLKQFHCGVTEFVMKGNFKCPHCNANTLETEIIRDIFTANMTNDEVQKDLLAETKSPTQAFQYAIQRENGLENQLQIRKEGSSTSSSQQTGIKSEPVGFIQKRGDSYRNNRSGNEVDNNYSGETRNDKATTANNLATNSGIRLDPDTFNNARPRIRSVINVQRGDTTTDYVILQTLMQSRKNKIPNKLYKTRT